MKGFLSRKSFHRLLELAGMINIISGIVFIVKPALFFKLAFNDGLVNGPFASNGLATILSVNLWALILIMGVGYLWAAQDMLRNRLLIFIGGIGKTVAALSWIIAFIQGAAKPLLLAGAATDLSFGVLFIVFFLVSRSSDR